MPNTLVIDDDPAFCLLIAQTLEQSGHEVETVSNGRQALFRLAEARFDLIITDILMPEMDGIEFIRRTPITERAPILAISGYGSDRSINFLKVARMLGADASLRKPFTGQELRDVVASLLAGTHPAGDDDEPTPYAPGEHQEPGDG